MNALELIAALVKMVAKHGNQEVVFFNGDYYRHVDVITLQSIEGNLTRLELE